MNATEIQAAAALSSYQTTEQFFAARYQQGTRTVFGLALTPDQLTSLVARPDPAIATPGNRRIRSSHALGFARYFIDNENWVIPGIILRAPAIFQFETSIEAPNVDFGFMSYPKRSIGDIHILDGQHRILGFFAALDMLNDQVTTAQSKRAAARRTGMDERSVADFTAEIERLERARDRFYTQRVSVEIQVTDNLNEARQMFFDIADNALGITASVKARFDTRQAINRALAIVLESDHALLANHVDVDLDRVQRNSPYLLSARQVAEITRVLAVGFDGRISRRMNAEMKEEVAAREALEFFTTLVDNFPPLFAFAHNQVTAKTLRETMLLGNPLFLRVLAGVQYELVVKHGWPKSDAIDFLSRLAKHTTTRAHDNSIWRTKAPEGSFGQNALGPSGRRADSTALVRAIADWAVLREVFVDAEPLAPPVEPLPDEDAGIDFAPSHDTRQLELEVRDEIEEIAADSKKRLGKS